MKNMYISFILVTFIQVLTRSLSHLALDQYENETQFYLAICANDNVFEIYTRYILYSKNIHNDRVSIHVWLHLIPYILVDLKDWGDNQFSNSLIDILDILTNALSDTNECPFAQVTIMKVLPISTTGSIWYLNE